jgi:hypothetical protein
MKLYPIKEYPVKDKIARTKQFAQNHRTVAIAFTSGVLVGGSTMLRLVNNRNQWAFATPEMLQRLIDKPAGGIRFDNGQGRGYLYLINTEHPKFK